MKISFLLLSIGTINLKSLEVINLHPSAVETGGIILKSMITFGFGLQMRPGTAFQQLF